MARRLDYQFIEEHVPCGARVLDLGCGDGKLLEELIDERQVEGLGIEIDEDMVRQCIARGVPVYHGDMYEATEMFDDGSFDCVILSRTLQQALKPGRLIEEILRIGEKGIISFPNFGRYTSRLRFLFSGRRPCTGDGNWSWYDTPNLHPLTVKDFEEFCREKGLKILGQAYYTKGFFSVPSFMANLLATYAVFVVTE